MAALAPALPEALYSVAQAQAIDRQLAPTTEDAAALMERAGHALLNDIQSHWPQAQRLAIVCGPGNNGGDGLVLARRAMQSGYSVSLYAADTNWQGAAATAWRSWLQAGGQKPHNDQPFSAADVIVDALFGIGLKKPIGAPYAAWIQDINNAAKPILAADLPSGLDGDCGQTTGPAIVATRTLCLLVLKRGLFTASGPDHSGALTFCDLALSPPTMPPSVSRLSTAAAHRMRLTRQHSSHKGHYGQLLLVGGGPGMGGALQLAARAALRVGLGKATAGSYPPNALILSSAQAEIISHGLSSVADLLPLQRNSNSLLLGPGLGRDNWAHALARHLLASSYKCKLIDADGLYWLSQDEQHNPFWILTPHPGEAGQLLDCSSAAIQADRFGAAQQLQQRYGGTIVLKGNGTLIEDGETTTLIDRGHAGMASAGMGDVLAGVIAGLRAQGYSSHAAACYGCWLHASAACNAASEGGYGMLASDLLPLIRHLHGPCQPASL